MFFQDSVKNVVKNLTQKAKDIMFVRFVGLIIAPLEERI
jgi:hypothetical protein